jgi:photosystem II stability/assembly factor-like uncharacterized protein
MKRRIKLPAIAALLCSMGAALAGQGGHQPNGREDWRAIGPAPPAIEAAILSDPASHTVYVASNGGGVLKSTDGGESFTPMNQGLDSPSISAMAMVPNHPEHVYAATINGIYHSVDGGAHWIGNEDVSTAVTFAIDPHQANVAYVGLAPAGGVFKTTDGGDTWVEVTNGMGEPAVFSLAMDANDSNVLYAGTQGSGAFKTIDGGATWTPLAIDTTVWSVLIDPANSNVVYAGTNGNGVFKSIDAGASFARIGSPQVGVVLTLAKSGQELYAGTATQGVSVSIDGGRRWTNTGVSTGLGLILSIDSSGAVFLGTNFDGAFMHKPSRQGVFDAAEGRWHRVGWQYVKECNCQNGHALAIDPSDHEHVFFSTNDGGLLVNHDGGRNWSDGGANGLVSRSPRGIAIDPRQPRHVYAGSFTGGGLFTSHDHGEHWQRHLFGSAALYVTGLSVDPIDHSLYIATLSGDGIWKSTDFGETFTRIDRAANAAPGVYLRLTGRTVTVDPNNHNTVYAAVSRGATAGIWRSQDAGMSWMQVDTNSVFSVTVDPGDSHIVYAGAASAGVLKSVNGGASFVVKSSGLPDEVTTSRTGSVQIDPRIPSTLYVGTEGTGVFKSLDGGESWSALNMGLDDPNIFGLALDPDSPDTVYASTALSVFKTRRHER